MNIRPWAVSEGVKAQLLSCIGGAPGVVGRPDDAYQVTGTCSHWPLSERCPSARSVALESVRRRSVSISRRPPWFDNDTQAAVRDVLHDHERRVAVGALRGHNLRLEAALAMRRIVAWAIAAWDTKTVHTAAERRSQLALDAYPASCRTGRAGFRRRPGWCRPRAAAPRRPGCPHDG